MGDLIFKLKPVLNKKNGQINLSLRKGELPPDLRKAIKHNPSLIKSIRLKMEGYDIG